MASLYCPFSRVDSLCRLNKKKNITYSYTVTLIQTAYTLKWTLRKKMYLFVQPKGAKTKYLKLCLLKIFSICHLCQRHLWCTLSCDYLREFSKKFETALWDTEGLGGNWFMKKNLMSKISCHCPFKQLFTNTAIPIIMVTHLRVCLWVSLCTQHWINT